MVTPGSEVTRATIEEMDTLDLESIGATVLANVWALYWSVEKNDIGEGEINTIVTRITKFSR